jgi:hypothetical protein
MIGSPLRANESDVVIEPAFRKLQSAIEAEREDIRSTRQQIEQERDGTTAELKRLRADTEEWCKNERGKIDSEWKKLDKLSEYMANLWPKRMDILEINCSGQSFTVPRCTLCAIEDSTLSQMFSDSFIQKIPRDSEGRLYLDFNPHCFSIIVDYLRNRRLRQDAPVPVVPSKLQQSMDVLAEALKLKPFMNSNQISPVHSTSLRVTGSVVQAMHPGWQVISATNPLPFAGPSYFEAKILANPNLSGGLAIGVCGHIPAGDEVHSIRLRDSVLYNSNIGLVGDCHEGQDVKKGLQLKQGDVLGIRHNVTEHCLYWFYNSQNIGTSAFKPEYTEKMRTMFPVFALYAPDTRIQVDFSAQDPTKQPAASE